MKLQRFVRLFGLLLIIIVFFSACEKTDETAPSLSVITPIDNEAYSVGESIHITGSASDESTIESIKIVLWDNLNKPALPAKYIHPESNAYTIDLIYLISDSLLETGNYQLLVSATDGKNETRVFRNISISGVEKEFERLIVIAPPNILKTYVYSVDTEGSIETVLNEDYGYYGSSFSNDRQKLFIIKSQPSILYAYDISDYSDVYDFAASPPYPEFNSVNHIDDLTYLPGGNGDIRGLDNFGNIVFVTQQNMDTIPLLVHPHDNYLLAYCTRRGGPDRFIKEYYRGTGVYRARLKIGFSIVSFFGVEDDLVMALGNNEGLSSLYFYNVDGNNIVDEIGMPTGIIHASQQISNSNILIAHDNGIYSYSHQDKDITLFLAGVMADAIAYDHINELIYLGHQDVITVYRLSGGEPINKITMPYPVQDIYVQYNK